MCPCDPCHYDVVNTSRIHSDLSDFETYVFGSLCNNLLNLIDKLLLTNSSHPRAEWYCICIVARRLRDQSVLRCTSQPGQRVVWNAWTGVNQSDHLFCLSLHLFCLSLSICNVAHNPSLNQSVFCCWLIEIHYTFRRRLSLSKQL